RVRPVDRLHGVADDRGGARARRGQPARGASPRPLRSQPVKLRRPAILRRAVRGIGRTVAHRQGMRSHLPFLAVPAVHLVAKLIEQDELAAVTKTLLMPALALVLVTGLGRLD